MLQIYYLSANGAASTGFAAVKGSGEVFFTNIPAIVFAYSCQQGKQRYSHSPFVCHRHVPA
jgi:hypothetical protein